MIEKSGAEIYQLLELLSVHRNDHAANVVAVRHSETTHAVERGLIIEPS